MNNIPIEPSYNVREGDIITISSYEDVRWLVRQGPFWYEDAKQLGWYVESMMDGAILPLDSVDPAEITIVSHGCPPKPGPKPPSPPPPLDPLHQLEHTWITVDTIASRDALDKARLPMGKIVRVNFTPRGPQYFVWNRIKQRWYLWDVATADQVNRAVEKAIEEADIPGQVEQAVDEKIGDIEQRVEVIENAIEWELFGEQEDSGN